MTASLRTLAALACLAIVAAALQQARELVVPFLLAAFVAVACEPPLAWLRGRGLPNALALAVVLAGILAAAVGLGALVGASVEGFREALPAYLEQLHERAAGLEAWLAARGVNLPAEPDPAFFLNFVSDLLSGFGSVLANVAFILLTVAFILAESLELPARLRSALGGAGPAAALSGFAGSVNRYLAVKALTSLLTGALVAGWLVLLGIDHAALWGLVAFLFNFIPTIGSFLAAVPAVLLAALQGGPVPAALAAAGYLAVNVAVGIALENRLMGRQLGLSALVVFVSLVFWGWLLGPVGMLLSIPLTVVIKLGLEASPATRPWAELLGPGTGTR